MKKIISIIFIINYYELILLKLTVYALDLILLFYLFVIIKCCLQSLSTRDYQIIKK